ncbi:MAG: 16S rRNA (cytidine(1402)-2'-O)-methyltransferase [Spirochaetota bacterium]
MEKTLEMNRSASPGTLYIIATPLGNPRDISLRALDILSTVDTIACESAGRAGKLLREHKIPTRQLLICQAGNEAASAEGLVQLLRKGRSIAYISDAGTPGISDPGLKLVATARRHNFAIEALPGPSALTLITSLAPWPCAPFSFIGFLSPKSGRRRRELARWLQQGHSFIFYESPFRVLSTLKDLGELAPERAIFLGREMTKKNAQFLQGTSDYLLGQLEIPIRGELTLLVAPKSG